MFVIILLVISMQLIIALSTQSDTSNLPR